MSTNLTIMEWNIHQQGLHDKDTPLPMWIIDEFEDRDIVVLTEYCHRNSKSGEFVRKIHEKGYSCTFSTNTSGNDVLIAVKNRYQIVDVRFVPCGGIDGIPENLRVDIGIGGDILSVIGVRIKYFRIDKKKSETITDEDYQKQALSRAKNLRWLMDWIKEITNQTIITGDFNNYRRGTPIKEWNLAVIDQVVLPNGFIRETPQGQSVFDETANDIEHEFAYDHVIFKSLEVEETKYFRDFVRFEKVYTRGKNLKNIPAGYPDHAILKGTISLMGGTEGQDWFNDELEMAGYSDDEIGEGWDSENWG